MRYSDQTILPRVFQNVIGDAVLIAERDTHRIILANAGVDRMFRREAASLIGQPLSILFPDAAANDRFVADAWYFALQGKAYSGDVTLARPGGETFAAELIVTPGLAERGVAMLFIGIHELSQSGAADRAATEALTSGLRTFVGNLPGLLYIREQTPDGAVRYPFVGGRFLRYIKQAGHPAPATFSEIEDLIHPDDRAATLLAIQASEHDMSPLDMRVRFRFPDQTERTLRAVSWPERRADGAILWFAAGVDMMEQDDAEAHRQRLEAQFRQAQKMESVVLMAGGVAHDFNNLLTVILGKADVLSERLPEGEDRDDAELIVSVAQLGAGLVQRLLAFARQQVQVARHLDVNALVQQLQPLLRSLIGTSVDVRLELAPSPLMVHVDKASLESAVINLAANARDAMPEGGILRLEIAAVELASGAAGLRLGMADGPYVRLRVADTGHGIAPDALPHVFEPFFTTKPIRKGTGLGLSTVHEFVWRAGGNLTVESEVDVGASFDIYLPRQATAAVGTEPTAAKPAEARAAFATILILDHDPLVRRQVAAQATRLGYATVAASGWREALGVLRGRSDIDLLLTDVLLTGVPEGPKVVTEARRLRPDLKVVCMLGHSSEMLSEHAAVSSGIESLCKPFRLAELAETLKRALA
jgi:signal transduction histidine kinase